MEKTLLPGYKIPWVLFLALPQTGFVTPWKSLQLSEAVSPLCAWDADTNMLQAQVRRLNARSHPPR